MKLSKNNRGYVVTYKENHSDKEHVAYFAAPSLSEAEAYIQRNVRDFNDNGIKLLNVFSPPVHKKDIRRMTKTLGKRVVKATLGAPLEQLSVIAYNNFQALESANLKRVGAIANTPSSLNEAFNTVRDQYIKVFNIIRPHIDMRFAKAHWGTPSQPGLQSITRVIEWKIDASDNERVEAFVSTAALIQEEFGPDMLVWHQTTKWVHVTLYPAFC